MYATVSMLSTWRDQSHKSVTNARVVVLFRLLVKWYNSISETENHSNVKNIIIIMAAEGKAIVILLLAKTVHLFTSKHNMLLSKRHHVILCYYMV